MKKANKRPVRTAEEEDILLESLRLEVRALSLALDSAKGIRPGTTDKRIFAALGQPCELMPEVRDLLALRRMLKRTLGSTCYDLPRKVEGVASNRWTKRNWKS
jgi:hypothetical protein